MESKKTRRAELARNREIIEKVRIGDAPVPRFVENRRAPDWGIGRVLSEDDTYVRARFRGIGVKVLSKQAADLKYVPAEEATQTRRATSRARPTEALGVVFVNIGWSTTYDGSRVRGNHKHLNDPEAIQNIGSAEESLFVKLEDGRHWGPLGSGAVPSFGCLDIVFVSRPPDSTGHKVVAVFRECTVEASADNPSWRNAWSMRATCFKPRQRMAVEWPGRMSMRRWAVGGPKQTWPGLRAVYEQLVTSTPAVRSRDLPALARAKKKRS